MLSQLASFRSVKEFSAALDQLVHDQWVSFHWSEANPLLHRDLGMLLLFLLVGIAGLCC